jgi:hypothetical protein
MGEGPMSDPDKIIKITINLTTFSTEYKLLEKLHKIMEVSMTDTKVPLKCNYFIPRKQRRCRLMAAFGRHFCGEHLIFEKETEEI